MNATISRRRAGYSLIELLVVIGLLSALAAIGTGVYFRISAGATVKATEETVSKATSGFQQIWSAELDNARDSFAGKSGFAQYATQVDNTKAIAGGDVDRARALWTYLWMKNAFPQTIAEATTATTLTVNVGGTNYTVSLPARPTFSGMTAGTLSNPDQAATLLYRILTQKGSRGQTYNEEAIGSLSVVLPGTQYRAFTDAFGYPLTFVFSSTGIQNDVNGAEYQKGKNPSRDPFDPTGTLLPPPATLPPAPRPVYWTNNTARVAAATLLGRCITPGATPVYDFENSNWQPTIVSRGASRIWDPTFLVPTLKTPTPYPANYFRFEPIPDGYLVGYKLRRQGARGDQ